MQIKEVASHERYLSEVRITVMFNMQMLCELQDEVYSKCVENLINSSFDGYNATVFAYGQTVSKPRKHVSVINFLVSTTPIIFTQKTFQGSGKTHTIGGLNITSQTEEDFGVIPRAVKQMFEIMKVGTSDIEIFRKTLQYWNTK